MGQIWTIGHGASPADTFLRSLESHRIGVLADVRFHPGSRRSPQFGQEAMRSWLGPAGVDYVQMRELGGRRPKQDVDPAVNAGWQNPSFKNYADYTLLPPYRHGIARLLDLASTQRVAVMCAEPTPWRCHRMLIANTLDAYGWTVLHLIGAAEPRVHQLGEWGADPVVDAPGHVTYPAPLPDVT